jgi:negative regulator of genetic competence, sporulation and motility
VKRCGLRAIHFFILLGIRKNKWNDDSVRREVLYNILIEFGVPTKLLRPIKICLMETYGKVRIDNHSSLICFLFTIVYKKEML